MLGLTRYNNNAYTSYGDVTTDRSGLGGMFMGNTSGRDNDYGAEGDEQGEDEEDDLYDDGSNAPFVTTLQRKLLEK